MLVVPTPPAWSTPAPSPAGFRFTAPSRRIPTAAAALAQGGGVLLRRVSCSSSVLGPGIPSDWETQSSGSWDPPTRSGDSIAFATIAPRVYLSERDLPSTGLLKPGSPPGTGFNSGFPGHQRRRTGGASGVPSSSV